MRGGTSKACFFRKEDLPENEEALNRILLRIFGSPDPKQIDGMGGTYPNTSKAAIISRSDREDADINYDFRQIGIDSPIVAGDQNCGNISSAVGPYAIDEGLVTAVEPETLVRIYNQNTGKLIHAYVPTRDGKALTEGEYEIAGVPGTAARIDLDFLEPEGSATGTTLPTGNAKDTIEIDGITYEYSFVDAANPIVFVRPEQFGIDPTILPVAYERLPEISEIKRKLEIIRGTCAVSAGLARDLEQAKTDSPGLPKMAFCSRPRAYSGSDGRFICNDDMDVVARFITLQGKMAPAFAVTGGICLGVAACIMGTIVHESVFGNNPAKNPVLRIGHPCGIMDVSVTTDQNGHVLGCRVGRTARRIMDGYVYVKKSSQ